MRIIYTILLVGLGCFHNLALSQESQASMDIESFTKDMRKYQGYFDFYWDNKTGKIWLEIRQMEEEFIYITSLPAGIGSNDLGLDRGQLGGQRVVKFSRSGPKVLLTEVNYGFRAVSSNRAERVSVEEAFAKSVIGGFTISAESQGRILVDLTDFLIRDAHNYALGSAHSLVQRLKDTKQGIFQLDQKRSAMYMGRTKSFPENTEFETTLTFALRDGEKYGDWVNSVVPSAEAITVRLHHSFVKLPDDNYQMRALDPRCGYHGISFQDYATPIDQPLVKHFIHRHRLEKLDPSAKTSEVVEPIVYYVDPGAPEPIRSALIEGASWWNQAFEAAGFSNAFQVKVLPEDADPMDVRYNVIQWVHRSTRGWSYGLTVADPRTGEIIKGHVSLGSLRVRQDFLIAQGLLPAYEGPGNQDPRMLEMALARLKQLSAHEVGHTLGLIHNFAASTNNRASVMDYPHPLVTVTKDGTLDFDSAYDHSIGRWDIQAIKYGYQDFPQGIDESEALNAIIQENISIGLRFITDQDARPAGGAHPLAHLWDNGFEPVKEMDRLLAIRKVSLDRFGENNIPFGAAWSTLEEVLVPLYLSHRYQSEAVSKLIGGVDYTYALRGDGQPAVTPVPKLHQQQALEAMLAVLDPEVLAIPHHIRALIPPKAPTNHRGRESFKTRTGVTFDPISAAESAAAASIDLLLNAQRVTRLAQQQILQEGQLGLSEVIDQLIDHTWKRNDTDPYFQEIRRLTGQLTLSQLVKLSVEESASIQARAIANQKILELDAWINQIPLTKVDDRQQAHYLWAQRFINQYKNDPKSLEPNSVVDMPDGSPIGAWYGCSF